MLFYRIGAPDRFAKAADTPKDTEVGTKKEKAYYYINQLSDNQRTLLKNKKIVFVDAGKFKLVYMVDENRKKLRYTARQRRHESKSRKNHQIILKEKERFDVSRHLTAVATQEIPGYAPKTPEEAQRPENNISLIELETALSKHN